MVTVSGLDPVRLYRVGEVAEALGMTPQAVRELIARGGLRARRVRPSGHPRVSGAEILRFTGADRLGVGHG